ncbi:MAG: hypothetical protein LAT84_06105 [Balneolia bacterium]|nr:hypothetical protein [Balneolia bacterium]
MSEAKPNEANKSTEMKEIIRLQKEVQAMLQQHNERIAAVDNQLGQLKTNLSAKVGDVSSSLSPKLEAIRAEVKDLRSRQPEQKKQLRSDVAALRRELEEVKDAITLEQTKAASRLENRMMAGFAILFALFVLSMIL